MGSERISLGGFTILLGVSLFLSLRKSPNDQYAAVVVLCLALLQLFEYGVFANLECEPGQSNAKASKGAYLLLWAMPAILCISASLLGTNMILEPNASLLLMTAGGIYFALFLSISMMLVIDRSIWCSTPGSNWQPVWYFMNGKTPLPINYVWLLGILLPTILVDPWLLGAGTLMIGAGAYSFGLQMDPLNTGEWASVTGAGANLVALWALLVPALRTAALGPGADY
jgi:hypothetical protein